MKSGIAIALVTSAFLLQGCTSTTQKTAPNAYKAFRYMEDEFDLGASRGLRGRTISVSVASDLRLKKKEVVLTFEDGLRTGKTENVLKTLDRYGVSAVFFAVGNAAAKNPTLANKVIHRGHAVGSNTLKHVALSKLPLETAMAEVVGGQFSVSKAICAEAPLFQFPRGRGTAELRRVIAVQEMVVVDATIYDRDWRGSGAPATTKGIMKRLNREQRGIISLDMRDEKTPRLLQQLLQELANDGYKVITLRSPNVKLRTPIESCD